MGMLEGLLAQTVGMEKSIIRTVNVLVEHAKWRGKDGSR